MYLKIYMSEKPKVYFSKIISPENLINIYKKLNFKLEGNIGIKIHSGEKVIKIS